MSTSSSSATSTSTSSSTSTAGPRDRIPPHHVFDHCIWSNPAVCNHCFSRIRDTEQPSQDYLDRLPSDSNPPSEVRYQGETGIRGHDYEVHDAYGELRTFHPKTFCAECGSNNGRAYPLTLSKATAVEFAKQLGRELRRQHQQVDVTALVAFVKHAKSLEDLTDYDREIFERGTAFAIRRAREDGS